MSALDPAADPDEISTSPVANLCNMLIHDSLTRGATLVEFVGAGALPVANQHAEGTWQPYMQYPAGVFAALVSHLKQLAGIHEDKAEAVGVIHAQHEGREVALGLAVKRASDGTDLLTLRFPAAQSGE